MRRIFIWWFVVAGALGAQVVGDALPGWSPGVLDIHQIQTGRGNAAFLIFPDGTTLLIDAGAVPDRVGLEIGPARPDGSRSAGEWIAQYVRDFSPRTPAVLDYALITHYHDDHMAAIGEVVQRVPIRTLLDRGLTPAAPGGPVVERYFDFRRNFGGKVETLRAGRADQIVARYADFEVRNVAVNGEVWTGEAGAAKLVFPAGWERLANPLQPTENSFSAALRIRYGRFRYFTGGDLVGLPLDELPAWHDLETPIARAMGPVDVMVANHHGWLDTTNSFFLRTLAPRVVVIPAWHASHPDHGVMRRLVASHADLFITSLLEAPRAVFSYLREPFRSSEGHVVVRVSPGGAEYRVFVLDDRDPEHRITGVFGPYRAK